LTRLPRITAKELLRALKKSGFYEHHQVGSHVTLKNGDGARRVVAPYHTGAIIKLKTLKAILKDAGLGVEDLVELL